MNIYIAGPMRGYPYFNFPAFLQAEQDLIAKGYSVFNPAARDLKKHGKKIATSPTGDLSDANKKGFSLREALAADTRYICLVADAIALLPGWKKSKGATAEHALSVALGHKIYNLRKNKKGKYKLEK